MTKVETTKILLALPEELKKELQEEADKQYRSLNNYILWLLVHRHENKPELPAYNTLLTYWATIILFLSVSNNIYIKP